MRRVDNADGEPRGHQREKHGNFVVVQRKTPMISGENRTCGGDRVLFAKNRVGRGDGRLRDGQACVHVAKIDDAHDLSGFRRYRPDKSVVIVGIAIDDAATEVVEAGNSLPLEQIQEMLSESAPLGIGDSRKLLEGPKRTAEIPLQNAVSTRAASISPRKRPRLSSSSGG